MSAEDEYYVDVDRFDLRTPVEFVVDDGPPRHNPLFDTPSPRAMDEVVNVPLGTESSAPQINNTVAQAPARHQESSVPDSASKYDPYAVYNPLLRHICSFIPTPSPSQLLAIREAFNIPKKKMEYFKNQRTNGRIQRAPNTYCSLCHRQADAVHILSEEHIMAARRRFQYPGWDQPRSRRRKKKGSAGGQKKK